MQNRSLPNVLALGGSTAEQFVTHELATEFQCRVLGWFDLEGRKNLPWQNERTPYRVWVSEIMLQQTQVATVIPYFLRFMERFPSLESLAAAETDDMLQYWAGLGYYARARNLQKAARIVREEYNSRFPDDLERLCALPGIGRSTAGAILSMGSGIRAPILDGNVKRVLSRFAGLHGWPGGSAMARELWELSERVTPVQRVADYTQAIMDLGATLCTRSRPACPRCPLRSHCRAYLLDLTAIIPTAKPRRDMPARQCLMLLLRNREGAYYLEKRPPVGIWGGLWSFPEFDDDNALIAWCAARNIDVAGLEPLPQRRHTFTHFHLDYTPVTGCVSAFARIEECNAGVWCSPREEYAVPAPTRKLMLELEGGSAGSTALVDVIGSLTTAE